mgnify:CR=1 FL=1
MHYIYIALIESIHHYIYIDNLNCCIIYTLRFERRIWIAAFYTGREHGNCCHCFYLYCGHRRCKFSPQTAIPVLRLLRPRHLWRGKCGLGLKELKGICSIKTGLILAILNWFIMPTWCNEHGQQGIMLPSFLL